MTAIQNQVISIGHYKKHIWKDPNTNEDSYRKYREELQTIQHVTGACRVLAQGDNTHGHNQLANIVHREMAIECGLSEGPAMLYHTNEPQSVLEDSDHKLCNDKYTTTDRTVYNSDGQKFLGAGQKKKNLAGHNDLL